MAKQTETFQDVGLHERIYVVHEDDGSTWEYSTCETPETQLDLPCWHRDKLREMQELYQMDERQLVELIVRQKLEELF